MKTKLIYFLLLIPVLSLAQMQITGTVKASDGGILPGVSVVNLNTKSGAVTDFDGNYTINANKGEILQFSYLGTKTQDITVGDNTVIHVILETSTESLDEVVVVGYGQSKKRDLTGSISSIKADDLTVQPAVNAVESIQGLAPGIDVTADGAPGGSPVIRIRGLGTASAGRDPLYVVDGIILDNIDDINPEDIESLDVLKDASSLAIYGSRGANGVIIITTKQGKVGAFKFNVSAFTGVKDMLTSVDLAGPEDYQQYIMEQILGEGQDLATINAGIADFGPEYGIFDPSVPSPSRTDWFDEITRLGKIQNYNVSISGGTKKVTEYFNAGFYNEEDIIKRNDFRRYTFRNNLTFNITDKLTFKNTLLFSIRESNQIPNNVFSRAYRQAPIAPIYLEDGSFSTLNNENYSNAGHPISLIERTNDRSSMKQLTGGFTLDYKLNRNLSFKTHFGFTRRFQTVNTFNVNNDDLENSPDFDPDADPIIVLNTRKMQNTRWVHDFYGTYNKTLGGIHNVKVLLGTTTERIHNNTTLGGRYTGVPFGDFDFNISDGNITTIRSGVSPVRSLRSYITRVNYDYDHKYLLTLTGRRDGSSQFKPGHKWGNFYSVGAAWVVSDENFMSNVNFVDFFKIKGSWGELGNQNVSLQVLTFASDLNYATGPNNGSFQRVNQGSSITQILDEDLSWEVTREFSVGAEFKMFDNRLTGGFDYYNKLNTNAILQTTLEGTFGASNRPFTNLAKIRNEGKEISLGWRDKIGKDFTYSISGNFSYNRNELEEILTEANIQIPGGIIGQGSIQTKLLDVGQPIGSWFLATYLGADPQTGDRVYKDLNEDGTAIGDFADREFHGSPLPKYNYGININLNYKQFSLVARGYGIGGGKIYNGKKQLRYTYENIEQSVFDNRWTTPGQISYEPRAVGNDNRPSTYYLESSDFFRINNITLSYVFKNFIGLNRLRLYATAKNPFIFTKYSGYNPSLSGGEGTSDPTVIKGDPLGNTGFEFNAYPATKQFIFGTQINF
ncbi:TonB-dependent receptor [Tamlana sp. 2201CG12-4]|uniref:SusC/RagA family TonB-linked outer membrane protein n=1 Tax=Tamlana sp. 2201CG12-4 TaxID=3112582 RepID=UPI002DB91FE7|nr:TonB-dependent receptor [Tamlana sp. 2201CG12-4]MEC3905728.1 TonB-dependent receptor [Tamlana sp. 2201CG12-4]